MNQNRQKLKKQFFESTHGTVKSFLSDKGLTYNSYSRAQTKGWVKQKKEFLRNASKKSLKIGEEELAEQLKPDTSQLLRIRRKMINSIEKTVDQSLKTGDVSSLYSLWKIIKTELGEPVVVDSKKREEPVINVSELVRDLAEAKRKRRKRNAC